VLVQHGTFTALVAPNFETLLRLVPNPDVLTIDVPIGLPACGSRRCDLEARQLLKKPRSSSVFPAPVRACLNIVPYNAANAAHRAVDGRGLTRQAFAIMPKIREVDTALSNNPQLQGSVFEVHPEVCFAVWNGGRSMVHKKSSRSGHEERTDLIEARWPGLCARLAPSLSAHRWKHDDLHDALAALWTAERVTQGAAIRLPRAPEADSRGLRMEILA
jgi:predicted RNase H-like nuclease